MAPVETAKGPAAKRARWRDSDLWWSLKRSPLAMAAGALLAVLVVAAFLAPLLAIQDPYNLAALELLNAELPPIWQQNGQWPYLLGTDVQGRDIMSAILYGSRVSIIIGIASVVVSLAVGLMAGLAAGYIGGWVDNLLMRVGDVLLSIPTILMAILVSAVFREILPANLRDGFAPVILIIAISLSAWVQYARTVRALAMVERGKEYVQAARLLKVRPGRIMRSHILPNTLTPILVAATLNFGLAILIEATLSFLGVGMPPTEPSLGTLIRIGNEYLFSGQWWIVVFPAIQLSLLVLSVNVLGDWLRDALNPKLR
jgi:peptide/nickel transport system permease protein